ncbi:hypothetical protein KLQ16_000393, partial [Campylobacter lari]|nr:hypothetical protein [Campylobacter lari]
MKLFVFSSLRAVRKYYDKKLIEDGLLDQAISMADFMQAVVFSLSFKASHYE